MTKNNNIQEIIASLVFDERGLIPAIAQQYDGKDLLMLAWMNREAIERTLETGKVHYWSRSREALWLKGETSGHTQKLVEFRLDCDRDSLLLLVDQTGPACHTNRPSCFYYKVMDGDVVVTASPVE